MIVTKTLVVDVFLKNVDILPKHVNYAMIFVGIFIFQRYFIFKMRRHEGREIVTLEGIW